VSGFRPPMRRIRWTSWRYSGAFGGEPVRPAAARSETDGLLRLPAPRPTVAAAGPASSFKRRRIGAHPTSSRVLGRRRGKALQSSGGRNLAGRRQRGGRTRWGLVVVPEVFPPSATAAPTEARSEAPPSRAAYGDLLYPRRATGFCGGHSRMRPPGPSVPHGGRRQGLVKLSPNGFGVEHQPRVR